MNDTIYCACCNRPFTRPSLKGPAPRYCSDDCRRQIAVRRAAWGMSPERGARATDRPRAATG